VLRGTGTDQRLVAYVVPEDGEAPSGAALRAHVARTLPAAFVPSAIVVQAALPLMPNGKVDRAALARTAEIRAEPPAPPAAPRAVAAASTAPARPRDRLEYELVRIWERVLHRGPVGVHDDFFELGGHSLLAAGLFAEIHRELGRRLPLVSLFRAPTIAALADELRREGCELAWSSLVALQPAGARPPLFLAHYNGGHLLIYGHLVRKLGPDQPVYGLQAAGLRGERALQTSVEAMAEHYVREMRSVQPNGPFYLGGACLGGVLAYEMARRLRAAGEEVRLLALLHAGLPTPGAAPPSRPAASLPGRVGAHLRRLQDLSW
jgi:hypothetical protein